MSVLKFCKEHSLAKRPTRATSNSAGFDLYSVEYCIVEPRNRALVNIGIKLELPPETYGRIAPRSGLSLNYGIDIGAGVIDQDYRGVIKVLVFNHSDEQFIINPGDRIAQLICEKICYPILEESSSLDFTLRGSSGFGSSVSCLFGVDSKCIEDPTNDFHKHGRKIAELTWQKSLTLILAQLLPRKLCGILGMRFTDKNIQDFFLDIARTAIDYREKNNINRNDLIDAMKDLKDQNNSTEEKKYIHRLNDTAAQCFVAFIAAHETTATVLKFALFEIAFSPKVQDILRNEIQRMVIKYNGELSYESLSEMEYLEGVVLETLRKYPVCPVLLRSCNKTYQVPNTNITLKPGCLINIPVLALHMDPQYHTDPHMFIPERFSSENTKLIKESTFLPFGIGPRGCLGYKFGKLIVKAAIIEIVRNYEISLNKNVKTPLELGPNSFFVTTKDKVWVNLRKIEKL